MNKSLIIRNTCILLLCTTVVSVCFGQKSNRPNILFIISDDHTSQAWGIYGGILSDYVKNDRIKWLADHGVVLENAFCTNSICVPSRASIMTGQYSHKNGVYDLSDPLPTDSLNFAQLLQNGGYRTALFGKWHLHDEPSGFDKYMVLPGQGRYKNPVLISKGDWKDGEQGGKPYSGFSTDIIADKSIEWLRGQANDTPFYLSVHFKATHEPFDYHDRYKDYLKDVEVPYPDNFADSGAVTTGRTHDGWPLDLLGKRYEKQEGALYPGDTFSPKGLDKLTARKKIYQKFIKDYIRCGAGINDNIGKLIDYLRESGQLDNTVIIYTSDQGYFLGEHGFFDKRFIYEQSLRMPFVISYPKEFKGGTRNKDIILNVDFPSLFLDFAGLKPPAKMQGRSFRENLRGKTPANWRKEMYYRYWANEPARPAHFGIRTEQYKLALFYGQSRTKIARDSMKYLPGWEFYDLKKDPAENYNAMADPQNQQIINELKGRLRTIKSELGNAHESNSAIEEIIEHSWDN